MINIGSHWVGDLLFLALIIVALIIGFFMGLLKTLYYILGTMFFLALLVGLQPLLIILWKRMSIDLILWLNPKIDLIFINNLSNYFYIYLYYLIGISFITIFLVFFYFLVIFRRFKKITLRSKYQRYYAALLMGILGLFFAMFLIGFLGTNMFYTTKNQLGISVNEITLKAFTYQWSHLLLSRMHYSTILILEKV